MDSELRRPRKGKRLAATLFDDLPGERAAFIERVRTFALEVAKRHRRGGGDLGAMLVALRGWHRTWAICEPDTVPQQLDDSIVSVAVAAYRAGTGQRRQAA